MPTKKQPILVTGSHRSGSTWVGKMIANSPRTFYIHEPFNPEYYNPGICGARFDISYRYVTEENEDHYFGSFARMMRFKYDWLGALREARRFSNLVEICGEARLFRQQRRSHARPLIKDPLALLSTEWLARRFSMQVIVLVRHPAAFVSSLKRFNWDSPFDNLIQQPLLISNYLYPFSSLIHEFAGYPYSRVEQAALFWRLLYYVVDKFRIKYPDWYFVRHEDLSRDPVTGFRRIFAFLSLPFTAEIEKAIRDYSSEKNPRESPVNTSVYKIDSQANIYSWKNRLTIEEIDRVRAITRDVAELFYAADEW